MVRIRRVQDFVIELGYKNKEVSKEARVSDVAGIFKCFHFTQRVILLLYILEQILKFIYESHTEGSQARLLLLLWSHYCIPAIIHRLYD